MRCYSKADYEWGTLSTSIPGRVGYQCSNYYRTLVKNGDVVDTNYMVDEKGQMRFNFKNKGFERPVKVEGEGAGEGAGEGEDGVVTNSKGEVGHYVATKVKAPRAPPKPKAPRPPPKAGAYTRPRFGST